MTQQIELQNRTPFKLIEARQAYRKETALLDSEIRLITIPLEQKQALNLSNKIWAPLCFLFIAFIVWMTSTGINPIPQKESVQSKFPSAQNLVNHYGAYSVTLYSKGECSILSE